MVTGKASKAYKSFIEIVCAYYDMFEGLISINDVLQTPYPIFQDVIEKQIKRKKRQTELVENKKNNMIGTNYKAGDFTR